MINLSNKPYSHVFHAENKERQNDTDTAVRETQQEKKPDMKEPRKPQLNLTVRTIEWDR